MGGCSIGIGSVVLWFMVLAPHLSLYVVVLVFIMDFIGFALVGSIGLLMLVGGLWVVGGLRKIAKGLVPRPF